MYFFQELQTKVKEKIMMTKKNKNYARFSLKGFMVIMLLLLVITPASELQAKRLKDCTKTTQAAYKAGLFEMWDDFWIAIGNCFNLADLEERADCLVEAREELKETRELLKEQREARCEICDELGEAPYDPVINPDEFIDFEAVLEGDETLTPNPYFPLVAGTTWEYLVSDEEGELLERIIVTVQEETTEILGVNCIVVRDRVWEFDEGEEVLIEDTDDWYGQDLAGNVWYMGEIALNYEDGELVDIEGSWKAGRDFAKPGYLMLADPQVGDYYRQEYALGDAEDMGAVESRGTETVEVPYGIFMDDVLQTRDWTPIEPDVLEFKYYAPGVGMIKEFDPESGEQVELVDMTTP
jgi:hypothetical protein